MKELLNTLYVMTQDSYLRIDHDTLRLEVGGERRLITPIHHLQSLVLFGNVMATPFVFHRFAEDNRTVVFLDYRGRFKGRLEGPQTGNVLLRRAQHMIVDDQERAVFLSKAMVAGKIQNARQVLLRAARDSGNDEEKKQLRVAAEIMATALQSLGGASSLNEVRGFEGHAAETYFSVFSLMVRADREHFAMNGRNRRPPLDPVNALLSFLYALLLNDCLSALQSVGLDCQVGVLHGLRSGRPGLGLDLMEEFRSFIADRLALSLINRKQITGEDFETRPGGAVYLVEAGRRKVITEYQRRKQEKITHPLLKQEIVVGLLPFVQARLLARFIRGDAEAYLPFLVR
ncbi:CRISPR-associated endonuclease Cas1 1 [Azospirillaceae bacterium]